MSKIDDLLKKLEALAERGVGGEKDNAARMLADLRRKHGISTEEVEHDRRTTRFFPLFLNNPRHTAFVGQCIGSSCTAQPYLVTKVGGQFLEADVTHAEYLEIEAKIAFYWAAWLREEQGFFNAFVQLNRLGAKPGAVGKPPTAEELADIRRKAQGMDAQSMHKHLQQ